MLTSRLKFQPCLFKKRKTFTMSLYKTSVIKMITKRNFKNKGKPDNRFKT